MGTDNGALRADPLYVGVQEPRLNGAEYYELVDEFVQAIFRRWPNTILQFEDFNYHHAAPLLERYRYHHLVFNDDIQGTAAVAVAGLYGALQALDLGPHSICNQKIMIIGAGSAGMGVASLIAQGMISRGLSHEEAYKNFWLFDHQGLITCNRESLEEMHKPFARTDTESTEGESVLDVLKRVKPTVLIGLAGAGRLFTEEMLTLMGKYNERPIIMPMSNPTSKMECTAEEAQRCTQGRAIFASGSPQAEVVHDGKTLASSQANNMYIFPGLALGAFLGQTGTITDNMIMTAAESLPGMVEQEDRKKGATYPRLSNIRQIGAHVATQVLIGAAEEGKLKGEALKHLAQGKQTLAKWVQQRMFTPKYTSLVHLPRGVME